LSQADRDFQPKFIQTGLCEDNYREMAVPSGELHLIDIRRTIRDGLLQG
jgi:hypothetical protein